MKKLRYKLFFLLTLFLLTNAAYSQFMNKYAPELNKYLRPPIDTTKTKEIAFFMGTRDPMPEYSLRIIKTRNIFFTIEARVFRKNLATVIANYNDSVIRGNDKVSYTVETITSIVPISNSMKDKMLSVFNKVISNNIDSLKSTTRINADGSITVTIYDGPTYKFAINEKGPSQREIIFPLDSTDFRYKVVETNIQIIDDLKNNSFDETKYDIYK